MTRPDGSIRPPGRHCPGPTRWRMQSQTTFDEPVFIEPCLLTGLDVDATPVLKAALQPRLAALAQSIDRIVRDRTEAKQRAEMVWQKLQEPVEFAPNQWLQFHPRDARVSPITSNGTLVLHTSVNLVAGAQDRQWLEARQCGDAAAHRCN